MFQRSLLTNYGLTKILLLSETVIPDRRPIGDLNMLHPRPTCLIGVLDMLHRRPTGMIGDPSETSTCYIGEQHVWSKTHRRLRHATSITIMHDRRPIKDQHSPSVTDIPHRRLTCLISVSSETSTCFIGDPSETNMPHRRSIWNRHAPSETHCKPTCL